MLIREAPGPSPTSAPSLVVEDGKTLRLSSLRELTTLYVRPRNVYALQTLAGLPTKKPARLGDSSSFERLYSLGDLVDLEVKDDQKRVGGYSVSFVKNIVAALDPEQPIPDRIKFQMPSASPCGCHKPAAEIDGTLSSPKVGSTTSKSARVSISEFTVPAYLQRLSVAVKLCLFEDIIVGFNSTLILDSTISCFYVRNFLAYQGSRITQDNSGSVFDIVGTLRGSIPRIVHSVSPYLKIDFEALSRMPAGNP